MNELGIEKDSEEGDCKVEPHLRRSWEGVCTCVYLCVPVCSHLNYSSQVFCFSSLERGSESLQVFPRWQNTQVSGGGGGGSG